MTQKLRYFCTLLLMAVVSVAWADDVTMKYSGSTTTNMTGNNDAELVGLSATDWSVIGAKGGGSNFPGLNKDGTMRLYASSGNGSTITVTNNSGNTISSISFDVKSGTPTVLVGDDEITGSSNVYAINSTSFTVKNAMATGQVQINSITISYSTGGSTALATTTTIDATGITNTDVYLSTEAGSLSATVTETESGDEVSGATVTWTSSKENVATVDENGVVTLVAAGTTTITAAYAGVSGEFVGSSATYELTVTSSAPYVQPTEFEIGLNNALFGTEYNGSVSGITDANAIVGTQDNVTVTYAGSGNHYVNDALIRFYPNNKLTFEAPDGYEIKEIVFTADGQWNATISADGGTYDSDTKTWSGSATSVLFTGGGASGHCRMSKAAITLGAPSTVKLTIRNGFTATTFSCDKALDFSGFETLKAYIITDGEGTIAQVSKVPAGEGLYIVGAEGNYEVPFLADETQADPVTGNKLIPTDGTTEFNSDESTTYYVFGKQNGKEAFYKVPTSGYTPSANKAVLKIESWEFSGAKDMIVIGGDVTGIESIENGTIVNDNYYTIDGKLVKGQPTQKGIYVVNGRKVVIK